MSVENEIQANEKQRVQLWTWWNSRVLVQDIWHEWSKNCLCLNKTIGKIIPKVCIFGLELLEFDRTMFPHGTEEGMQSCLIIQYICFMAFPPRGFGLLSLIHVLSAPSVCRNTALHRTSWLKAFHIISSPKKVQLRADWQPSRSIKYISQHHWPLSPHYNDCIHKLKSSISDIPITHPFSYIA